MKSILAQIGSLVVAYSGGTDSTLVLKVAHDVFADKAIALTGIKNLPQAIAFQPE